MGALFVNALVMAIFYASRANGGVGLVESSMYVVRRVGNSYIYNRDHVGVKIGRVVVKLQDGRQIVVAVPFDPTYGSAQRPYVLYDESRGKIIAYVHRREIGNDLVFRYFEISVTDIVFIPLFFDEGSTGNLYLSGIVYNRSNNTLRPGQLKYSNSGAELSIIDPDVAELRSSIAVYHYLDAGYRIMGVYVDPTANTVYAIHYDAAVGGPWRVGRAPIEEEDGSYYLICNMDILGFRTGGEYRTYRKFAQYGYVAHEIGNAVVDGVSDKAIRILVNGVVLGDGNTVHLGRIPIGQALPYRATRSNSSLSYVSELVGVNCDCKTGEVASYENMEVFDSFLIVGYGVNIDVSYNANVRVSTGTANSLEDTGIFADTCSCTSNGVAPRTINVDWNTLPPLVIDLANRRVEIPKEHYLLSIGIRNIEIQ